LVLALVAGAYAKEHAHDSGTLLQMDSAECGTDQKSGKSLAGEIIAPTALTRRPTCCCARSILLQSERIIYRIRPKDDKHPYCYLGQKSQFRRQGQMKLRVEDMTIRNATTLSSPCPAEEHQKPPSGIASPERKVRSENAYFQKD